MEVINGVKCHFGSKLCPPGFFAITLFGHVFFKNSYKDMIKRATFAKDVNHERIHILQGTKLGWVRMYLLYVWYFLKGFIKTFSFKGAYYTIPFEREAYTNDVDFTYNETHWRDYCNG